MYDFFINFEFTQNSTTAPYAQTWEAVLLERCTCCDYLKTSFLEKNKKQPEHDHHFEKQFYVSTARAATTSKL